MHADPQPTPASVPALWRRAMHALRAWRRIPAGRLAVEGLPPALAELGPTGVYVLYGGNPAACDALLFETARQSARPATLVMARPAATLLENLRARGFDASWPRDFDALSLVAHEASEPHASGATGLTGATPAAPGLARLRGALAALARRKIRRGTLLLLDGAQDWFAWGDAATLAVQARALAAWCDKHGCAMLLVLPTAVTPNPHRDLHDFHSTFKGVAALFDTAGEMVWTVSFWRWRDTLITGENLPLRFAGARLTVAPAQGEATGALLAADEDRVIASSGAVDVKQWLPPHWELADDLASLRDLCRGARGATVLLGYGGRRDLEPLAETIHALRREGGRALKIVVRERGESLWHQYELLCLRLGANLIVSRDTSFSRLLSLMQSVQGQVRMRAPDADFHTALAAALNDPVSGYLNLPAFCERVAQSMERARILRVPHLLVKLRLRVEVAHLDALRALRLERHGDVCTANRDHCYLFLFSCRMSDADEVLPRCFAVPTGTLFDEETRYADDAAFASVLTALREDESGASAPDYTDTLADGGTPLPAPVRAERASEPARPAPAPVARPSVSAHAHGAQVWAMPVRPRVDGNPATGPLPDARAVESARTATSACVGDAARTAAFACVVDSACMATSACMGDSARTATSAWVDDAARTATSACMADSAYPANSLEGAHRP